MASHRVRRAFQRVGESVGDDKRARIAQHVQPVTNLQVVFPGLWSSACFDGDAVPVHKFLHVQAV